MLIAFNSLNNHGLPLAVHVEEIYAVETLIATESDEDLAKRRRRNKQARRIIEIMGARVWCFHTAQAHQMTYDVADDFETVKVRVNTALTTGVVDNTEHEQRMLEEASKDRDEFFHGTRTLVSVSPDQLAEIQAEHDKHRIDLPETSPAELSALDEQALRSRRAFGGPSVDVLGPDDEIWPSAEGTESESFAIEIPGSRRSPDSASPTVVNEAEQPKE